MAAQLCAHAKQRRRRSATAVHAQPRLRLNVLHLAQTRCEFPTQHWYRTCAQPHLPLLLVRRTLSPPCQSAFAARHLSWQTPGSSRTACSRQPHPPHPPPLHCLPAHPPSPQQRLPAHLPLPRRPRPQSRPRLAGRHAWLAAAALWTRLEC